MNEASEHIYKILPMALWAEGLAEGVVPPMPIDVGDGYMHFSTAEQLRETLRLHFRGQSGLVVLAVDQKMISSALRWEKSRGGALFPHLYGDLPVAAVREVLDVYVDAEGVADLPERFL